MRKTSLLLVTTFLFLSQSYKAKSSTGLGKNKSSHVAYGDNGGGKEPLKNFTSYTSNLYQDCQLASYGLDLMVFQKGLLGFYNIAKKENVRKIISIIDFDKPSTEKRLWIIDLENKKVLFHTLVAHGKNSGNNLSVNFSNTPNSNMSSLGFYITRNTYQGKHGLSLVIDGLDKDINSNAKARSIVIHGADYVSEDFIKCTGRLGRSQGCPAVPVALHKDIINTVKDGSVLFINKTNPQYTSEWLDKKITMDNFYSIFPKEM